MSCVTYTKKEGKYLQEKNYDEYLHLVDIDNRSKTYFKSLLLTDRYNVRVNEEDIIKKFKNNVKERINKE